VIQLLPLNIANQCYTVTSSQLFSSIFKFYFTLFQSLVILFCSRLWAVIVVKLDHNKHHEIYIVLLISSKALQVSGRGGNVATMFHYSIKAACSNFPMVYVHQMYVETEFSDFIITKQWPTSLNDKDITSEKIRHITCISHLSSTKTRHQICYINERKWPDLLKDRGFKTRERKKPKSLANVQYKNCGYHLSNP